MEDGAGLFIYGVSGLLEKGEEGDTEKKFSCLLKAKTEARSYAILPPERMDAREHLRCDPTERM